VLHSRTLYDELIKVPIIVVGPGIPAGKVIKEQVQSIDIMPTILELCGADAPPGMQGHSLLPLIEQEDPEWSEVAFAETGAGPEAKRSVRTGRYKLYYDGDSGEEELYDLLLDPAERTNILEAEPDLAEALRVKLKEWMTTRRGNPATITLTKEEEEMLRALGYLH
jgi:choline-sulfatase